MEAVSLSNLEQKVMSVIWGCAPCSIKEVKAILDKDRKLAYTTVATLIQRLENKGMLKRTDCRCPGNCIKFTPKITKQKYTSNLARTFLDRFQKSFGDVAIASFADSVNNLTRERRAYFLKLLSENDQK